MDRKEAIKILQKEIDEDIFTPTEYRKRIHEALDMAIEALSAEQKEEDLAKDIARRMATIIENEQDMRVILKSTEPTDLISRADAIKAVANAIWHYPNECYRNLNVFDMAEALAKDAIKSLPSADRPTELLKDGTLKVNVNNGAEVNRVLVWGDDGSGGLYYADDRPSGEWEDKEVFSETNDDHIVDEWQSARCSICGKYHTTPYMYYFEEYKYCPNCGAKMGGDTR